jgi:hypothetical protein
MSLKKKSILLTFLLVVAWSSTIFAQDASTIVRVEEDWSLDVTWPAQGIVAPQLATVISPVGHTNSIYGAFALNHRPLPEFAGGGLQLQVWNNDVAEQYVNYFDDAMLNHREAQETVTWTQAMSLENGNLTFEVLNGQSQTWGQFGGDSIKTTVAVGLADLNQYSPSVSVANSGISYAANRVRSLSIKKVRWITSDGQVYEDANPKVVYPHP